MILARALAQQTQCLILDEPTNHLDIKYQLQLMDIVRSLRLTVVAAIHDLNIAAMYCNKLFVLQNGRIIAFGPPKQVLTREFIRQVYEVEAKLYTDPETGQMHILRIGRMRPKTGGGFIEKNCDFNLYQKQFRLYRRQLPKSDE